MKKAYPRYVRSPMGLVKLCLNEKDEEEFMFLEIKTGAWVLAIGIPIGIIILIMDHLK